MTSASMSLFTIDTLQFSKRLHKAGLEIKIAEAIKDTHIQSLEGLATKYDIALLRKDFEVLENKFDAMESRLLLKMFFLTLAAISIVTWIDKVIN